MNFLDIGQEKSIFADGIHDDTAAIQSCLDKMKNGGTIYFPDGTYLISAALIFYSGQWLKFSDNARLLRSAKSENITKYMLASFSQPDVGGYDGTHDVVISGGIFDGNRELTEKLTILNTVHCTNITVKNSRFVNGAMWHYIEFNSTKEILVLDCVFDGLSYTAVREDLTSELIQLDAPDVTTYGPVYDYKVSLIDFKKDKTPCTDAVIASNIFKCNGFTAIGHHGNDEHTDIKILNNVFTGLSGNEKTSRGFITFMEKAHSIEVSENAFISTADEKQIALGIRTKNPDNKSLLAHNNVFIGKFDEYFTGGISEKNNSFQN